MKKEQLKRIFEFLEEKENHNVPFLWKLINNEPLTEEDLNFEGDLFLRNSKITSLPEGLKVGGNLSLYSSKNIKSLPKGLEVNGFLIIGFAKITKYTDIEIREMIKPGFIKGRIVR